MNIGTVSRACGLPDKTIRYYEEIGLIHPARGANGYRDFSDRDLHKLTFLARARSLGFSIEDCRTLMSLYEDHARASADVKMLAQDHIRRIEEKVAKLLSMRDTLNDLVTHCHGDSRPDCPILDDLAGGASASGR
ncbi:Cu(I)-responsive transcriptional regulator [Paracoccus seriniphilus]|uniref:Cu(I)-responsive transcriptional regulator n=1 Tax=Paracoccus seriniphilus TaxID=184748 RepID=A0A239PUC0_9RHOB|nr:Cu(I)-responsive transcriptional regulator [Paracoccus seriniphilus]WCR16472.1 Cu(I)-responsive transcriptional regulator [Paracoccus seriniphilus]SNT73623.1 Cu(I)-responsive transcriptional regulator [Paracoccus seriniphilus]